MMSKYYLYVHFRQDKQELFYVGIGTRSKTDLKHNTFTRAYSRYSRTQFWRSIVYLNPGYKVLILIQSNTRSDVVSEEVRLIQLLGRKDLHSGSLCNLTNGGEGTNGFVFSSYMTNRWSELAKKRAKFGKYNHSSKKVYQYTLIGEFVKEWSCIEDCNRAFRYQSSHIIGCIKGRCKTAYGFQWFERYMGEAVAARSRGKVKKEGYLPIRDKRTKDKLV